MKSMAVVMELMAFLVMVVSLDLQTTCNCEVFHIRYKKNRIDVLYKGTIVEFKELNTICRNNSIVCPPQKTKCNPLIFTSVILNNQSCDGRLQKNSTNLRINCIASD